MVWLVFMTGGLVGALLLAVRTTNSHVFTLLGSVSSAMERTTLWILLLVLVTGGKVNGQSCRPNAPRRDCGKPEGFSRVLIT